MTERAGLALLAVLVYLLACLGVGLWALRRTTSSREFFVAGRNLGSLVAGVAIFASTLSGFAFVGGPGLVYSMGTSSLWIVVTSIGSHCLTFYLLGTRLRMLAELGDSVSLPDAVALRYGRESTRLLTALAILLGVVGYLAVQILALARVLQSTLAAAGLLWSLGLCATTATAVLLFYCVAGGILASVYTDLFQGLVMLVTAVLVFLTARAAFVGGFAGMLGAIAADDPGAAGPWGTLGIVGCLSWYLVFGLGAAGQPHLVTKLMMTRRIRDARTMLAVVVLGATLSSLLWVGVGLVMRAEVASGGHPELTAPDAAAAAFLESYAHPVLAGVALAGLLAAIMSTADGFLNLGAAALVHDIPRALWGSPLAHELRWARIATVALGLASTVLALYTDDLVALLGAFGWGTFAAALVPTVAIGFNWKRATPAAANTAIVGSLLCNLGLRALDVRLPGGFDRGAASLLLSLLLFVGVSLLARPPRLDPDVEAVMDL